MNTPTDQHDAGAADLKAQAKEIMQEVADFLAGDHSHMSPQEYSDLQQQMMAKQSMAMGALLQSMGFEEKKTTLMQSEDIDVTDIKRRAGLIEDRPSALQANNFKMMQTIEKMAAGFVQNQAQDSRVATFIAKQIIGMARKIKEN